MDLVKLNTIKKECEQNIELIKEEVAQFPFVNVIDIFSQLIPTERNAEVFNTIEKIEIFYPNQILKSGISIIDTPGLSEILYDSNGKVSSSLVTKVSQYAKEVSAIVYVTTKDNDEKDEEILMQLMDTERNDKIFVVVNKDKIKNK